MADNKIKRVKELIELNKETNALYRDEIKLLEEKIKRNEKLSEQEKQDLKKKKESVKLEERRLKLIEDHNKELVLTAQNLGDIDDLTRSITKTYGKNTDLAKIQLKQLDIIKEFQSAIVAEMQGNLKLDDKKLQNLSNISAAYGDMQMSIMSADRQLADGEITMEKRNELIQEAAKRFKDMGFDIANIEGLSSEVKEQILKAVEAAESMEKAMKSAAVQHQLIENITEELSHELGGLGPILSSINTLTKTNVRDTLAWKAAVFALGAALGKAAFDYFGAPIKAGMQADKERHQAEIDNIAAVAKLKKDAEFIPNQIQQERLEDAISSGNEINKLNHEAQYAAQKAANSFSVSMQQAAAQFNAASKTALFGKGLGSVGYAASELQIAGISADKIAGAMSSAAAATGKMPTGKAAADMAIMAERTGTSVDDIAQITEHFQRIDGMSAEMSMNMAEGMRSMADQAGISLGNLMKEVAESSKEALGYQIKSGPALAKQVAFAQSLGVSFGDIAKAGKSMVLNYKDSIKAEMQLSSLLGEQVDLSEVRAKFAEGDTQGALKALQAQGLNPEDMDMFQQEALSQALGGMDLQSLSKIAKGKGAEVGNLKGASAAAGNKGFLETTKQAQASLSAQEAVISANAAVVDAKLSAEISQAYLGSKEYNAYKLAQNAAAIEAENLSFKMNDAWKATDEYRKSISDTAKLNFVDSIKEGLVGGLATVGGGLLTTGLDRLFKKGGGKTAAQTGGGGAGGGVTEAAIGMAAEGAGALIPGAGGVVEGATEKLEEIKGPIEETMSLGEKLKDFGSGLGTMLKDVGKGIGDFLKNTGTGISKFLQQIGSGLGKAIGGFFSGISAGLTTFAMAMAAPTPLFGLPAGLIIVGMAMGIAQALSIAGPGIEKITPLLLGLASIIGDTFVKVLQAAGPIITSIFNGIATVINSVGNTIATIVDSVANAIGKFATMDAAALTSVAVSIGLLATSIGAFGVASFIEGVGSFFGGGIFDDLKEISGYATQLSATAIAVEALASAFSKLSDIDVEALTKIPWDDMEEFAESGGSFVIAQSANKSFNITQDTADSIKKMSTNTEALINLNKTIANLLKEGFFGGENVKTQLYIDGKMLEKSLVRYKDNTKATSK